MHKKRKKVEVLYLAVTPDELELPLAVFSSLSELARWAGKTTAVDFLTTGRVDPNNRCMYRKVEMEIACNLFKKR